MHRACRRRCRAAASPPKRASRCASCSATTNASSPTHSAHGADARALTRVRAQAVEHVVVHVWRACAGDPSDVALFAVGGFGRGVLFPHSDVDLLVLIEPGALKRHAHVIEAFFACLWDVGLKPGHAVRDARRLPRACRGRYRGIHEPARCAASRRARRRSPKRSRGSSTNPDSGRRRRISPPSAPSRRDRHARFNDTAVQPRAESQGRARRPAHARPAALARPAPVTRAADFDALVTQGVLDPTERAALERSEATLRRYRYALHLAAGRAEERLLFDYQRTLATELGYEDEHEKNLAVEQFMQGYYRAATVVERLGAQVTERFDGAARSAGRRAARARSRFRRDRIAARAAIGDAVRAPAARDGRCVRVAARSSGAARTIAPRRCGACNARSRATAAISPTIADVLAAFLALLRRGASAVDALARMNRHGVLAALLPTFRRVVGRMQYDLFHVYTVDEHTLRVLRNVARFADRRRARGIPDRDLESWTRLRQARTAAARCVVPRHRQGPRRRSFGARRGRGARVLRASSGSPMPISISSRGSCAGIC